MQQQKHLSVHKASYTNETAAVVHHTLITQMKIALRIIDFRKWMVEVFFLLTCAADFQSHSDAESHHIIIFWDVTLVSNYTVTQSHITLSSSGMWLWSNYTVTQSHITLSSSGMWLWCPSTLWRWFASTLTERHIPEKLQFLAHFRTCSS